MATTDIGTETSADLGPMTAEQIVADSKRFTLFDWQAQSKVAPLAIDHAEGVYMYGVDGRRWLDFSSQLMGVNIGHGDRRVTEAIARQAEKLPYISPFQAFEGRAVLGRKLAGLWPGDIEKTFFTLAGAEANENAVKIAKLVTGRQKVLARYRSYHGSTYGTMMLTGDPRRWPNETPPMPGVVHVLDPYHGPERGFDDAPTALALLEETIELEGPGTIAAFILEPVAGTNGVLIPPDGYLQGVREICDRHGILMVADEVMAGFGRTGRWFAIDHAGVTPDLMTMAKGLTSSYLPLGAVAMRPSVAEVFQEKMFFGGLTYSSHPVSLAAALATISVYEEDDLIGNAARLDGVLRGHHERLAARHPSVGATRNLGLFGIIDLVRSHDPWTPLTPFNGTSDEMKAIGKYLRTNGLYTMLANNSIHTNPPLCITEDQLAEGFEIIDAALEIADQAVG
jgi:taurine---2-oxoglutarate transaminase